MQWIGYEIKEEHFGTFIRLREANTGNVHAFGGSGKNLNKYCGLIFKKIPEDIFHKAYGPSPNKVCSRSLTDVELLKYILLM